MNGRTLRIGVDASMLSNQRTGIGNYVFQLLRELKISPLGSSFTLHLYSHRAIAPDSRFLGSHTEHVGAWLRKGPLWLSVALPPLLVKDKIDVFWGANGYLPMQTKKLPWGSIVTIYDLVYHYAAQTMPWHSRWSRRLLQPLAVQQAKVVTTISFASAEEIRRHYHRAVNAIIPPGMDPDFTKASPANSVEVSKKYQLPPRYLFTLGTLEPRKNFIALLEAYAQVRECLPDACPPLVIAGARGWLDNALQQRLQRMMGFVPQADMPALYGGSELFLFFPLYEGYGMPVREALLCGASVLCSDLPALREAGESCAHYAGTGVGDIRDTLLQHLTSPPAATPCDPAALRVSTADHVSRFAQLLREAAKSAR
jgi:glycosyltransferase involved in cell wall biosynthesis